MSGLIISEAAGMLLIERLRKDFRDFYRRDQLMDITAIYLGRDEYGSMRLVQPANTNNDFAVYTDPQMPMEFWAVPIYEVAEDSHYGLGCSF